MCKLKHLFDFRNWMPDSRSMISNRGVSRMALSLTRASTFALVDVKQNSTIAVFMSTSHFCSLCHFSKFSVHLGKEREKRREEKREREGGGGRSASAWHEVVHITGSAEALTILCVRCTQWEREREIQREKERERERDREREREREIQRERERYRERERDTEREREIQRERERERDTEREREREREWESERVRETEVTSP